MSNRDLASMALARGGRWLQGARRALEDERWDDVVFSSQMAVETSSKAVLFAIGIDFPKAHDVSAVFREAGRNLRDPSQLEKLASNIATFAELRGLAEYAYERGLGGEQFKGRAAALLRDAGDHVSECKRLLDELFEDEANKRG